MRPDVKVMKERDLMKERDSLAEKLQKSEAIVDALVRVAQ